MRSATPSGTCWCATAASSTRFRALFGDEREDYGRALDRHYAEGPRPDWSARFVSSYATAHPLEDFAETWAHYLHIVDMLDTAEAFGLRFAPAIDPNGEHAAKVDFDPYGLGSMADIMDRSTPMVVSMNSINRAMGRPDLYPFVLAPGVIEKLGFIHDLVRGARRLQTRPAARV